MKRVLVVDDEVQIVRALRTSLQARGYEVLTAHKGEQALILMTADQIDVVILDLGLPDLDGVEVLKRLRSFSDVPVIVLTVRDAQAEKVAALDSGADDYVTKPFGMEEVMARMRAALRRSGTDEPSEPVRVFDGLQIDLTKQLVTRAGEQVRLTPTEYRLLEAMVTNPGKLLTHRWLLSTVWGPGYSQESHYLRVFVRQLRMKLEADSGNPRLILTEPGVGYRWGPEASSRG
jgi:two-component system KDP operon response regulator KdpE